MDDAKGFMGAMLSTIASIPTRVYSPFRVGFFLTRSNRRSNYFSHEGQDFAETFRAFILED